MDLELSPEEYRLTWIYIDLQLYTVDGQSGNLLVTVMVIL